MMKHCVIMRVSAKLDNNPGLTIVVCNHGNPENVRGKISSGLIRVERRVCEYEVRCKHFIIMSQNYQHILYI